MQDKLEELQQMAQDLIDTKILFDTEMKLELEKDPGNEKLLMIVDVINDVFHPRQQDETAQKNQDSSQKDKGPAEAEKEKEGEVESDFELGSQEIEDINLFDYLQKAQTNFDFPEEADDKIPSFSLGIDEDIYGQEEVNDDYVTPQPLQREKSTRIPKLGRFAKSPYTQRVVDINSSYTNQELGV